ncbi:AUGMIN subunit 6 [Citrus sinensis]|nr:AUGMIN subunit 6 [Citrus sinensis]
MYTNCLLLGLDPSIIGLGASNGTPRVGLFRHSNPKLGEQLLYFILSSLRGPTQSAKDFDKVWPIFDSAQSRDFRKVVQGIISELESQGALPRSNSRVSSLATCCGPRFVELLWQLSLHALREVHRRTFPADIASNPLPASLTDVAFSHAATLLPVTKARIALERRRFLKNAETAVQRQAMWSGLAHEMTAEFRGLCAEEAYLQQELEKLHELRNKVKLEGELWDDLVSSSSQNSHLVSKATRLWESILARKNQHEVLASGPIEDLIAHREHRYRISGSSLLAAMDQSSQVPYADVLSLQPSDWDEKEQSDGSSCSQISDESLSRADDRGGRVHPTVDVAEIIRRWTHALQRIHKQSLQLAKANDGDGPDILRSAQDGGTSGHAESLSSTLAEHQQHLASFQVLINQLKEVAPSIQKSISDCTDKVNNISSSLPPMAKHHGRATSPNQAQSSGRTLESSSDDVAEVTSKMSTVQLDKVSVSPPTLKLPQLFSLTPNSSGKGGSLQKRQNSAPQTNQIENLSERNSLDQPLSNNRVDNAPQDSDSTYVQNLKRSVREAALSVRSCNSESSRDSHSDEGSEHFFVPLAPAGFSRMGLQNKASSVRSKRLFVAQTDTSMLGNNNPDGHLGSKYGDIPDMLNDLDSIHDFDQVNGFLSAAGSNGVISETHSSFYDIDEAQDQVFSPPLLMETSLLADSYEDLLDQNTPLTSLPQQFLFHKSLPNPRNTHSRRQHQPSSAVAPSIIGVRSTIYSLQQNLDTALRNNKSGHRLLKTYFGGDLFRNITVKQFDALFEKLNFQAMDDIDALKTALFYFADIVLNGRKGHCQINFDWLNEVDDINYFRNRPLGLDYETIGGLPPAWVVKTKKKIPCIMQYKPMASSKINFAEVYSFFNDESRLGNVLQTLESDAKESKKKYWLTVKDYMPRIPDWVHKVGIHVFHVYHLHPARDE